MRLLRSAFLFVFTASSLLLAQSKADPVDLEHLKADIQFLSSDELQGRKTITPEAEIVARWIASEFARYGLKPFGNDFVQRFAVGSLIPDPGHSGIRVEVRRDGATLVRDLGPHAPGPVEPPDLVVSGPVAFAGFGISAPEYGYDDYAGLDARGKVLMIFAHEPAEDRTDSPFKGTWNTRYAYSWYKQQFARQHGAVALLVVEGEARRHTAPPPSPDEDRLRRGPDWPAHHLASEEGIPVLPISEREADDMLKASGKTVAELRRDIDTSIKPQSFIVEGARATLHLASHDRRTVQARNVVGLFEGSDPKLKNEYVVITAHFDHLGSQNGRIFHGADDNASGVAGLLEVMRAYAQGGARPKRSVIFAALDAEEDGLLGSRAFLAASPVPLAQIVANLNADMIGRDEDTYRAKPEEHTNSVNIVGTLYSPDLRNAVETANRSVGLALDYKMDRDDSENMFGRSDQFSFAAKDIPEVLFMTGFHRDYHTSRDTWDRIDYPKLVKITRLMFLASQHVANAPARPKWVP